VGGMKGKKGGDGNNKLGGSLLRGVEVRGKGGGGKGSDLHKRVMKRDRHQEKRELSRADQWTQGDQCKEKGQDPPPRKKRKATTKKKMTK